MVWINEVVSAKCVDELKILYRDEKFQTSRCLIQNLRVLSRSDREFQEAGPHNMKKDNVEESRIPAWKLHKSIYKIFGTNQEHKDTFFKTKTVSGIISRTGISHEER